MGVPQNRQPELPALPALDDVVILSPTSLVNRGLLKLSALAFSNLFAAMKTPEVVKTGKVSGSLREKLPRHWCFRSHRIYVRSFSLQFYRPTRTARFLLKLRCAIQEVTCSCLPESPGYGTKVSRFLSVCRIRSRPGRLYTKHTRGCSEGRPISER